MMDGRLMWIAGCREVELVEVAQRLDEHRQVLGGFVFPIVGSQFLQNVVQIPKRLDPLGPEFRGVWVVTTTPDGFGRCRKIGGPQENPDRLSKVGSAILVAVKQVKRLQEHAENFRQRKLGTAQVGEWIEDVR